MKISVRKYHDDRRKDWDRFIDESNNGTLFNYRGFLSYHIERSFTDHSLIFEKNGNILAVFPAAEMVEDGRKILFSHPGASFGGFIFNGLNYARADQIIAAFESYCREAGFDGTFFVPAPAPYFKDPHETYEYALLWRKYTVCEHYISGIIPLNADENEIFAHIYRNKNRSARFYKSLIQKHEIRFEWNEDYEGFYPILEANKRRHHSKPTHSLQELIKLNRTFPGKFHLLMMYSGDVPVGGTLIFVANDRVAIIFYNMIDYEYQHLQPATLQVMEVIRWGKEMGFSTLDFGVSQDPKAEDPLTPSPQLIRFKEELTARGMIRKAFCKTFTG